MNEGPLDFKVKNVENFEFTHEEFLIFFINIRITVCVSCKLVKLHGLSNKKMYGLKNFLQFQVKTIYLSILKMLIEYKN